VRAGTQYRHLDSANINGKSMRSPLLNPMGALTFHSSRAFVSVSTATVVAEIVNGRKYQKVTTTNSTAILIVLFRYIA
jgi:hypothetical protein